jgi:hypothetical protein
MGKLELTNFFAAAALLASISTSAMAQSEALQMIVTGDVALESTSGKAVNLGLAEAEKAAFNNAWIVIKRHPDVGLKVRNLTLEQNGAVVQGLKQRCAPPTMITYVVDKKLKRLSARYRIDCNLPDVLVEVDGVIRASAPAQNLGSRPKIAAFFIVKEIETTTSFDPNIDRSARATARAGVSQSDKSSATYQSDTRSRSAVREGYGETAGSVTDTYSSRDQEKGKVSASSTSSSQVSATEEATFKAQGRTVVRAADIKYRSASPEAINSNLTDVFKNASVRIFHYADISGDCPGPNPDTVAKEYGSKAEDLSSPIRTGIQKALANCQFKYMLLGDATVDTGQLDSVTGTPKVSVVLRTKIWSIGDGFPEVLATVERTASASNPDLGIARSAAMFQATQRVGEEVLSRLTAEGVR